MELTPKYEGLYKTLLFSNTYDHAATLKQTAELLEDAELAEVARNLSKAAKIKDSCFEMLSWNCAIVAQALLNGFILKNGLAEAEANTLLFVRYCLSSETTQDQRWAKFFLLFVGE